MSYIVILMSFQTIYSINYADVRGHVNVKAGSWLGGNLLAERNSSLSWWFLDWN
jgi:hypothetical protein